MTWFDITWDSNTISNCHFNVTYNDIDCSAKFVIPFLEFDERNGCPKNCPMFRQNKLHPNCCLSSKCILDNPLLAKPVKIGQAEKTVGGR